MITPAYCQTMARYNAWQNHSLYTAAEGLTEAERELDRGAFFGSIRATLSHLMWGDLIWIARFDGGEGPGGGIKGSEDLFDWPTLWAERPKLDARIAGWAWMVTEEELRANCAGIPTFWARHGQAVRPLRRAFLQPPDPPSVAGARDADRAGARPDDTDLPFMPDEVPEWR
jgi:uncharacterized damage-inducible protein DinB